MGNHFKMIARLVLISYITVFYSTAQIVVDDDNSPAEGLDPEDVDSRFFNINLGTLDLGQVAGTALGTTLGQLGTGFLNDCLGIGKRSVIMDRLVNKRSAQEISDDPSVDSRIIGEDDVNNRIFCLNNNNGYNNGGGFGGGFGGNRPSCNTCNCNYDSQCYNICDKCYRGNSNNGWGYSGNSGNSGNSFSNSNSGWSSSSSSSSNSGSSYSNVNCSSCSCRYSSCRRSCYKCNSGYRGSSSSSGTTFSQARSDTSDSNSGTSQNNNDAVQFGDA